MRVGSGGSPLGDADQDDGVSTPAFGGRSRVAGIGLPFSQDFSADLCADRTATPRAVGWFRPLHQGGILPTPGDDAQLSAGARPVVRQSPNANTQNATTASAPPNATTAPQPGP